MHDRLKPVFPPLILAVLILVIWEAGVRITHTDKWILPAPTDIFQALWENRGLMIHHLKPTLIETAAGLAAGTAAAILIAALIQLFPLLQQAVYPLLIATQTVPVVAIAPLFIVWFGFGFLPKLLLVMLVTFFPVVINLTEGFMSADRDMVRLLKSMGAGEWKIFRLIRFPNALPYLFSGLKIAATYSVLGAVVSEWLGASEGLGVFLIRAQNAFAADKVFAIIIVITFWSILLFIIVHILSRLIAPWAYTKSGTDEKGEKN